MSCIVHMTDELKTQMTNAGLDPQHFIDQFAEFKDRPVGTKDPIFGKDKPCNHSNSVWHAHLVPVHDVELSKAWQAIDKDPSKSNQQKASDRFLFYAQCGTEAVYALLAIIDDSKIVKRPGQLPVDLNDPGGHYVLRDPDFMMLMDSLVSKCCPA